MRIRPYDAADQSACVAVVLSQVPRLVLAAEVDGYATWLGAECGPAARCMYFVGEEDGAGVVAVGGVSFAETAPVATLCWGVVRAGWTGRGLGAQLLAYRLGLVAERGAVEEVLLDTTEASVGFFLRAGFRVTGRVADGYAPGWDRLDLALDLHEWRARSPVPAGR